MISTRSLELVIDTVVCLTLAKWETVSGQFGGYLTGMTVSLVARRHGVAPNQLFTWRRLVAQGSLTAAGSGEEVVPASDYRALQNQVRELHRLLGKKTLEAEILKEALEHATGSKKQLRLPPSPPKDGSR